MDTFEYHTKFGVYTIHRNRTNNDLPYTVFLHGGPGFNNYAERHVLGPLIQEKVNVLWFDMLGCHDSPANDPSLITLENTISDIVEIISRFSDGKANLISHCIGSQTIHAIAKRYPQVIHKVIFISPNESIADTFKNILLIAQKRGMLILNEQENMSFQSFLQTPDTSIGPSQVIAFLEMAQKVEDLPDLYWHNKSALSEYLKLASKAPFNLNVFLPIQNQILLEPTSDYFPLYDGKELLFLRGELDEITRWEKNGFLIYNQFPKAKFSIVPCVAHWPHLEDRHLSAAVICDFLGS